MNGFFPGRAQFQIHNEADLRTIIPPYPAMLDKRILNALDQHCLEIIRLARLVIFASAAQDRPMQVLEIASVRVVDSTRFHIEIASESTCASCCEGSMYFLVPGVGHGLRVNGGIVEQDAYLHFHVRAAYVHCARAAARADLWQSATSRKYPPGASASMSRDEFIQRSPYLMLKTMNRANETELSPRGDEPGFVKVLGGDALFIPERPGNKVAVSLRHILENPSVELLFFIPGRHSVLHLRCEAWVSVDEALLNACVVKGKRPKLGLLLKVIEHSISDCDVLAQSGGWFRDCLIDENDLTRFSTVLSRHMHGSGMLGKATAPVVQMVVKHDLKNLY